MSAADAPRVALSEIASCFEGLIPAEIATASANVCEKFVNEATYFACRAST